MVFCEAFFPWARRFFWHPQRLPIADAHYAMGFAFLAEVLGDKKLFERTVHFLNVLEETRCPGYEHYCWGYPFDWETKYGTIAQGTPLITTTPYAYEAYLQAYLMEKNEKWLQDSSFHCRTYCSRYQGLRGFSGGHRLVPILRSIKVES